MFFFQHLVVGNGGLDNGVTREIIYTLFSQYGQVLDVVMKKKAPYCFVSFNDVDSARLAVDGLHGQALQDLVETAPANVKIYLAYSNTSMSLFFAIM